MTMTSEGVQCWTWPPCSGYPCSARHSSTGSARSLEVWMYGNQTLADKVRPHLLGYLIPTFAQNKTKQVKGSTPKGTQLALDSTALLSAFWKEDQACPRFIFESHLLHALALSKPRAFKGLSSGLASAPPLLPLPQAVWSGYAFRMQSTSFLSTTPRGHRHSASAHGSRLS